MYTDYRNSDYKAETGTWYFEIFLKVGDEGYFSLYSYSGVQYTVGSGSQGQEIKRFTFKGNITNIEQNYVNDIKLGSPFTGALYYAWPTRIWCYPNFDIYYEDASPDFYLRIKKKYPFFGYVDADSWGANDVNSNYMYIDAFRTPAEFPTPQISPSAIILKIDFGSPHDCKPPHQILPYDAWTGSIWGYDHSAGDWEITGTITEFKPIQNGNYGLSMYRILDEFEDKSKALWLVGTGPGKSAKNRLNTIEKMILAADNFIKLADYDGACQQLKDIYKKCDGNSPPPDFVTGIAVPGLAHDIEALMEELGCVLAVP